MMYNVFSAFSRNRFYWPSKSDQMNPEHTTRRWHPSSPNSKLIPAYGLILRRPRVTDHQISKMSSTQSTISNKPAYKLLMTIIIGTLH
ncbi:hypothetical protein AVEN_255174-1 [Araneus ventricosus]|uniref:Uncharacterized protein n=1 Tax=Araneus ventricosus TaxID=182803 RepID=A0A4Y2BAF0_ARAVE|nr:hypothetical protein AVEN_255174-1 [Araneus ventricosus]